MKIMYVEDNQQNMRLVRKILNGAGYEMVEAVDGESSLRLAQEECPNLILMDINLPDMDGLVVTEKLKNMPQLAHIPVIALTANAMHGDRERFIGAGCDGYLPKPITKAELLNTVAHHTRRAQRAVE